MKLNTQLTLAALIAGSLMAGLPVRAQDANTNQPPAAPAIRRAPFAFEAIAKQLDLSEDQKTSVRPILADMQKQVAALRTDTTLSMADRRAKIKEIRDATGDKLKEVLTPEQYAKWQKLGLNNRRPLPPGASPTPATPPTPGN